jgi:hypothetical protein
MPPSTATANLQNSSLPHVTINTSGTGYSGMHIISTGTSGTTGYKFASGGGGSLVDKIYTKFTNNLVIDEHSDIYKSSQSTKELGVFQRLLRLERMLGILQRNRDLEANWPPLREIGDAYDAACDKAIQKISDMVAVDLKHMHEQYQDAVSQAKMYVTLTRD